MRRGRENQCVSERSERATRIWTRSSSFHTGPRRVNCRTMRPDTRKRLTTCSSLKKALASNGASTHEAQGNGRGVMATAQTAGLSRIAFVSDRPGSAPGQTCVRRAQGSERKIARRQIRFWGACSSSEALVASPCPVIDPDYCRRGEPLGSTISCIILVQFNNGIANPSGCTQLIAGVIQLRVAGVDNGNAYHHVEPKEARFRELAKAPAFGFHVCRVHSWSWTVVAIRVR